MWIAPSVEALVVMKDARNDVLELSHVGEDTRADLGVLLDLLELLGCEPAGFLEDGFGYADLADVVEQAGHVDAVHQGVVQPVFRGKVAGQQGHALTMTACISILGIDSGGEGVHESHHQGMEIAEEHGVFDINGGFVGNRGQQLGGHGVELACVPVQPEEATQGLAAALQWHRDQLPGERREPVESRIVADAVDEQGLVSARQRRR